MDSPYEALLAHTRDLGRTSNPEATLRRMQDSMRQIQDRIEQARVAEYTATDPSGTVAATVTGEGLRKVDISARALRDLPSDALGAACVAAIRAARLQSAEGLREQLTELVGRPLVGQDALPSVASAMQQTRTQGAGPWS